MAHPTRRPTRDHPRTPGRRRLTRWGASVGTAVLVAAVGGILVSTLSPPNLFESGGGVRGPAPTPTLTGPPLKVLHTRVPGSGRSAVTTGRIPISRVERVNAVPDPAEADTNGSGFRRHIDAVFADELTVELELRGNRPEPVRVLDIDVVAECGPPPTGTLFLNSPQGQVDTVRIGFDLGDPYPVARHVRDDGSLYGDFFADHRYVLRAGERATFRLTAVAADEYCELRYRFALLVGDRPMTQVIGDGDRPFEVSGLVREGGTDRKWAPVAYQAYDMVYGSFTISRRNQRYETPWIRCDVASLRANRGC